MGHGSFTATLSYVRALVPYGAAGLLGVAAHVWWRSRKMKRKTEANGANDEAVIVALKAQLEAQTRERAAERAGRVRAEKALRDLHLAALNPEGAEGSDRGANPAEPVAGLRLQPIGVLRSCFSQRNGTPRQALLVPAARARLELRPGVPHGCLEGLEQYSHCWLLYIFHQNTDLGAVLGKGAARGIKAKIRVPRLNGAPMGVLATRSPHRPVPIGMSIARIVGREGGTLLLSGADIVDGSPVLDVKPYVPFCDSIAEATAPSWVVQDAPNEPLHVEAVLFATDAERTLEEAWRQQNGIASKGRNYAPLYPSFSDFKDLLVQVLSRDIRSVHQRRLNESPMGPSPNIPEMFTGIEEPSALLEEHNVGKPRSLAVLKEKLEYAQENHQGVSSVNSPGKLKVILAGVEVRYEVDHGGHVLVTGASSTD